MKEALQILIIATFVACVVSFPAPEVVSDDQAVTYSFDTNVAGGVSAFANVKVPTRVRRSPRHRSYEEEGFPKRKHWYNHKHGRRGRFFQPFGGYSGYGRAPSVGRK